MRRCLQIACVYNLVWGAAMILAPIDTLHLLGVRPPSTDVWPQLWACIGMIIGVYGIGYGLASRDPARHWPITLVGLLGKILGPIGFVDAAIKGTLPWSMGWTIITNDLMWWIPFAMILWHAAKTNQNTPPVRAAAPDDSSEKMSLSDVLDSLSDQQGRTLRSITNERPSLVVLLRHAGCTFCKQTLADLASRQQRIEQAGMNLVVVGMSPTSQGLQEVGARAGVTTASWVADPDRRLYRALELARGSFLQLLGPRVWLAGLKAFMQGHGVGALDGDGFQMPGAFVVHQGNVVRAYRHATVADRPDLAEFACPAH
jgi:peroxiredoxin